MWLYLNLGILFDAPDDSLVGISVSLIIIAKTNVPQTMLSFERTNPVWGRSTNPWNDAYTRYVAAL